MEFRRALDALAAATWRPELAVEDIPAPQRIAPFSAAVTADVLVGDDEVGNGRLVLLHDPAGNDAWQGTFRCVTFARADVDPEMVTDPLLARVGWSWLLDALEAHRRVHGPQRHGHLGGQRVLRRDGRERAARRGGGAGLLDRGPGRRERPGGAPGRLGGTTVYDGGPSPAARWSGGHAAPPGHPEAEHPETLTAAPPPQDVEPLEPVEDVPLLTQPADGVPAVVETPEALLRTIEALAAGTGPVAVDAERASGYRYTQRAYLGAAAPGGCGDAPRRPHRLRPHRRHGPRGRRPAELRRAIADTEWVLHAASQDLPCLAEVGLRRRRLFDTELAARLLGFDRVALATLIERPARLPLPRSTTRPPTGRPARCRAPG